jgi:hypothetical protein
MIGRDRPRPAEALRSATTADEQLEWETVYDRRWRRHRDQLLTLVGVAVALCGVVWSNWYVVPAGFVTMAAAPAFSWWQMRERAANHNVANRSPSAGRPERVGSGRPGSEHRDRGR